MSDEIKNIFTEYVIKSEQYVMNLSEELMRREFARLRALVIGQEFLIKKLIEIPQIKEKMTSQKTTKEAIEFYESEITQLDNQPSEE